MGLIEFDKKLSMCCIVVKPVVAVVSGWALQADSDRVQTVSHILVGTGDKTLIWQDMVFQHGETPLRDSNAECLELKGVFLETLMDGKPSHITWINSNTSKLFYLKLFVKAK